LESRLMNRSASSSTLRMRRWRTDTSRGRSVAGARNSSAVNRLAPDMISDGISSGDCPGNRPTASQMTVPRGRMPSWIVTRSTMSRGSRRSAAADALLVARSGSREKRGPFLLMATPSAI
jgi:hypothetical protein